MTGSTAPRTPPIAATPRRGGRLYLRFLAIWVPVQAAILLAMTVLFFSAQRESAEAELRRAWERRARYVSVALSKSLAASDFEEAAGLLDQLTRETDVVDCRLLVSPGDEVVASVRPGAGAVPSRAPEGLVARAFETKQVAAVHDAANSVAHVAVPVTADGALRAVAVVTVSTAPQQQRTAALRERLAVAASAFMIAGIAVAVLLARYVVRPVSELAVAAERLAAGDYDLSVGTRRRDEIGALAGAFDRMVVRLRAAHRDLSVARADVERVLESMPDAVLVVDRAADGELRIGRANRAAAAMLGWDAAELEEQCLSAVVRDAAGVRQILARLDGATHVRDRDTVYVTRSGVALDVRLSASRIRRPEDATAESYVLVASDVSEVRRAERRRVAAYRLSELIPNVGSLADLLRGVESVLRTAMPLDAFHAVVAAPAAGAAAGVPPVVPPVVPSVVHWSDSHCPAPRPDETRNGLSSFALGAESAIIMNAEQVRLLVRRGEVSGDDVVPEHWASAPLRSGDGPGGLLAAISYDSRRAFTSADVDLLAFAAEQVSMFLRRRRAEEERTRLSTAVEHAVDAILILDGEGRVAYANPAYERQSGYTRAEIARRNFDELWMPETPATAHAAAHAAVWDAVRAGLPWSGSSAGSRRDGSTYQVDTTISAVRDASGAVLEYVVVQHDVSHERALEEQLRQSQKMEAIGLLAGGVAHDFNNLLSVILGFSELLRPVVPDEETRALVDEISKAGDRASSLVGQLLAFSRRSVIEPRPLDLREVVRDIHKMLRRLLREDIDFVAELPGTLDLVEADPGQLEQLLMNLAVNARDAMPRGGRLTIRLENEVIDEAGARLLHGLRPGRHVVLVLSDTGIGMSPEVRDRAFEPFFTTKARGQGTGLGLSTVYGIVQQANGHIALDTDPGRGTTFRIHFPSAGAMAAPEVRTEVIDLPRAGTETLLVAEDEPGLRSFVVRVLSDRGYRVLEAEDGPTAAAIARKHDGPIHLLLTDVVMPGMNGTELAAALRADRPDLCVLFMSGYPDHSIADHGILDPDVELLQKPFTSARLLKRVRRRIEGHALAAGDPSRPVPEQVA